MLPGMPPFPGEDFMNSSYPILIALAIGLVIGFRNYLRGTKCPCESRIDGKIVIITGANSGIGFETAKGLATRGGRVILACRDEEKANKSVEDIKKLIGPNCNVRFMKLDLASIQSVRDFVNAFKETHVDVLINNAGVMCHPFAKTDDELELHFQTNYIGHFLLTWLLLDKLKAAPNGGRVISVTANAYKLGKIDLDDLLFEHREYVPGEAYAQSKLALMLFSHKLAKYLQLQGSNVVVNVVNPGVVRTNIHRHMPFRQNVLVSLTFTPFIWFLMKASVDGAQSSIYCAVANHNELVSGKCYSECQLSEVESVATDDEIAEKLWKASFNLCGLPQ